uniref:Uncharacterized protein LOC104239923 n=1 Tax=Nicotiana sylvestris TaxID=4096 RepID=A0A1U7Y161_NICSY|nr:PREDICTED: uncharacterized protein LOC104239923 [Nicotiana sylvestris]
MVANPSLLSKLDKESSKKGGKDFINGQVRGIGREDCGMYYLKPTPTQAQPAQLQLQKSNNREVLELAPDPLRTLPNTTPSNITIPPPTSEDSVTESPSSSIPSTAVDHFTCPTPPNNTITEAPIIIALNSYSSIVEPSSYKEAVADPKWVEVMKLEIASLEENNTWSIVDLPKGKTLIGCKWVFKVKYKLSGEVKRYQARLVAKGYSQQAGLDYKETFSPVAKMVTIRSVVAVAASRHWFIYQMDDHNAFLQGDPLEEVYITILDRFAR